MTTWLSDLSAAVQKSGLVVHEVAGWQSRGHAHFVRVDGIVEHHTVGPRTGNMPSLPVLIHGRPGLAGPLCNLGLARDGSVYVVAAGVAWHAGVGSGHGFPANMANYYAIGIEAESTGTGDWTAAQLAAWPRLNNALAGHYHFSAARMIGHYEWTPRKIDPYKLPGGMTWLRAASAHPTGDNVTTIKGTSTQVTQLAANEWRTLTVSNVPAVSIMEGPGRVTGIVQVYLDSTPSASPIRMDVYLAKPDGKGGWVYGASHGVADFSAGEQGLRYPVAWDVPTGWRLRVRAMARGDLPPKVIEVFYNLDVRS